MTGGQKGPAQPGCGAQLGPGPCNELLPGRMSFSMGWFCTEEQLCCFLRLPHAVWPGREFSVPHTPTGPIQAGINQSISKCTPFPVIINALSGPALQQIQHHPVLEQELLGAVSTCGVLGASFTSQRGSSHPKPLAEHRFLLQSLLV